jgi:hypothetical protein
MRRRVWRAAAAALAAGSVVSCVTTVLESDPDAPLPAHQSVVVPLAVASATAGPVDAYYGSVIEQLQDAVEERDLDRLHGLLAVHDHERAPDWALARLRAFRGVAKVLAFEGRAPERTEIVLEAGPQALGAPLRFLLRVRSDPDADVELTPAGGAFPTNVLVSVTMIDHDCLGTRTERRSSVLLQPQRHVRLRDAPLELPFALAAEHGGASVLPGRVWIDGEGVPNHRVRLGDLAMEQFPAGVEPIRAEPLKTLRNALQLGDPLHFPHVFVAAWLMPPADTDAAVGLLIQRARLGRPDQARCAMAALARLTGEPLTVEDRDGWLGWWQRRSAQAPGDGGR